jgi:hypothetical protein
MHKHRMYLLAPTAEALLERMALLPDVEGNLLLMMTLV